MADQEYNKPLPDWAAVELQDVLFDMLEGKQSKGKGRHSKWTKQYRADMMDLERYDTVMRCKEYGVPWTDDKIFKAAALVLEGTYAGGSESTMKEAYKRVTRRQREAPGRYHILSSVRVDLKTVRPPTKRTAENMAKVRAMSKTPEKFG